MESLDYRDLLGILHVTQVGVSIKWGGFWSPYMRDPINLGSRVGPLIFGNSQIGSCFGRKRNGIWKQRRGQVLQKQDFGVFHVGASLGTGESCFQPILIFFCSWVGFQSV